MQGTAEPLRTVGGKIGIITGLQGHAIQSIVTQDLTGRGRSSVRKEACEVTPVLQSTRPLPGPPAQRLALLPSVWTSQNLQVLLDTVPPSPSHIQALTVLPWERFSHPPKPVFSPLNNAVLPPHLTPRLAPPSCSPQSSQSDHFKVPTYLCHSLPKTLKWLLTLGVHVNVVTTDGSAPVGSAPFPVCPRLRTLFLILSARAILVSFLFLASPRLPPAPLHMLVSLHGSSFLPSSPSQHLPILWLSAPLSLPPGSLPRWP